MQEIKSQGAAKKNSQRYSIFSVPTPSEIYLIFSLFYKEIRPGFFYICRLPFFEKRAICSDISRNQLQIVLWLYHIF